MNYKISTKIVESLKKSGDTFQDKMDKVLKKLACLSGESFTVSSYKRSIEEQAEAMVNLTVKNLAMYKYPLKYPYETRTFQQVAIDLLKEYCTKHNISYTDTLSPKKYVYKACKAKFISMIEERKVVYGYYTFEHMTGQAIDIAPSSLSKKENKVPSKKNGTLTPFEQTLNQLVKNNEIKKWIGPRNSDPAYHLVFDIKSELAKEI